MITYRNEVAGQPVTINVVETEEDLDGFRDFIRSHLTFLGLDSETTGLDIYADDFRCRLVQFGTPDESWVVPVELGPRFQQDVRLALKGVNGFVLHNASFDLQVFERTIGVPMEEMWPKVTDTRILAHLIDPRAKEEGGTGQSLEDLTRRLIDPEIADNVKTLMADLAKEHKTTKANVWKKVDLWDPHYLLYSGFDPILAARILQKLVGPLKSAAPESLITYEHRLAEVCSYMERTGFLLDVDYSTELRSELKLKESLANETALEWGCEKVNSTDAVADVLEEYGVKIIGRTPSGKRKVDDALLQKVIDEHPDGVGEFAQSVIDAKKAGKWRKTWVESFLRGRDAEDRCHASINPLRARTARMSISGIPAQTLPSKDWIIRRCFVADEGHLISSVDYKSQELRVLAALSEDPTMIQAFLDEADLHQITADASGVDRSVGKMANFLTVYGGGGKTLADQAKISIAQAKKVLDGFAQAYPRVRELSERLQRSASSAGYITTPEGRRLPVDETRAYSALNYLIQSTSRDVTGKAIVRLHDAGMTPYLRLPIHDEVLLSLPEGHAEAIAEEVGEIMTDQIGPVVIGTDPEVGGRSWGSLYGADN